VTAETANVARALAIQNSTLWKRGVHAENFQCNANRGYCANAVECTHTNSPDANDKLIQTRSHEQNTTTSRKWRFTMRKVHPLCKNYPHGKLAWIVLRELTRNKMVDVETQNNRNRKRQKKNDKWNEKCKQQLKTQKQPGVS